MDSISLIVIGICFSLDGEFSVFGLLLIARLLLKWY